MTHKRSMKRARFHFHEALLAAAALALACSAHAADTLTVAHDFPGGAAASVEIEQQRLIRFRSNGWAWWYFKVAGANPGETVRLLYLGGGGPNHACFSADGKTWHLTGPGERIMEELGDGKKKQSRIEYVVRTDGSDFFFAMYVPYLLEDATKDVSDAAERCPHARVFQLARSRKGHPVPAVRIKEGDLPDNDRVGIWIQARQHPWELSGSWAAAGFLRWITSADPEAAALRRRAEIVVVPMINVDGVQDGATMTGSKAEPPPGDSPKARDFEPDPNRAWNHPEWVSFIPSSKGAFP